jgi:cobyrinic acid a,c-diamide synthase
VLGALFSDDALVWRERHLGLVPLAEQPEEVLASIARLGEVVKGALDLDALVGLARTAPTRTVDEPPRSAPVGRCRIAVCGGRAFSFVYPENLDLLVQAGGELAIFDPLVDAALPEGCTGLYAGGGFPEVYAAALGENRALLGEVRRRVDEGMVTWAECGGYLWLCESLDGAPMTGVLSGVQAEMTEQLTIGYREATTRETGIFGPAGTTLRGHEFHRSQVTPAGEALNLEGRFGSGRAGYSSPTLFASYLHQHLSSTPFLAERFVAAALPPDDEHLSRAHR